MKKRCKRRKNAFLDTIKGVNFAYPLYPSRENKDILSFFTLPVLCYSSKGKQVNEYILLLASFFSFLGFLGFVYTKKRLKINAFGAFKREMFTRIGQKGVFFIFVNIFPLSMPWSIVISSRFCVYVNRYFWRPLWSLISCMTSVCDFFLIWLFLILRKRQFRWIS